MKTNQLLKSSLAPVIIAILATVTAFTVRQGEVTKTAHRTAPKDILQFTSGGHVLGFAKSGVYVANGSHALRVEFVNSRSITPMSAAAPSAADNANNAKKATPLSEVTYPNLWDGVTLTYDAPSGAIARSTYRLEPYANTENIRLRYNAPVSVQSDGALRISFKTETLNESAPQAWQELSGKRVPVQIAFTPRGKDEITFTTGHYDRSQPLFIDPTLTLAWNTFLGGSGDDFDYAVAVDGSGNVYVAGSSVATWGSPVNAFSGGANDAFVAKLDSTGNLTWNTFLGGSGDDEGFALAVDGSGNVYVAGLSQTTWGSPVRAYSGSPFDAFAAKLDSSGNLTWNTFLGGSGDAFDFALAVDGSGNVYLAGLSTAPWGSPVNAFSGPDDQDAFAAKLDSTTGNLIWNTFLGRGKGEVLAVDGSGNVYVAGTAYPAGGFNVPFAAKLDSSGNLTWNTSLGGSGDVGGLAVDGSGNVYVAGFSYATWGSPVRAHMGGFSDSFIAKLDSTGNLIWNTFLGGSGQDSSFGQSLAVDGSGNVYVAGLSTATWGSPANAFSGGVNAFAAQLDSTGNLTWNTFLGSSGDDEGISMALDGSGNVYVAGFSIGTWGSPVRAFTSGGYDTFVAKLSAPGPNTPASNPPGAPVMVNIGTVGSAVIALTFPQVTVAGTTTVTPIDPSSAGTLPSGYELTGGNLAFQITTTATYTTPPPIIIAFQVPSVDAVTFSELRVLHNEGGTLVDRTATDPAPDPTTQTIYASVSSLSPFVLAKRNGCQLSTSITSNFNGTPIKGGNYIWFNGVLKPSGLGSTPVTIHFTKQTITSANFTLSVPDASVTFDPTATSATTSFSNGAWVTRAPSSGLAGNTFFAALGYQVPNLPGGIKNVTWSATISPDKRGVSLQWQWAAAVYTNFSSTYNAVGVKPVDDNKGSQYLNSDHAGTPENFKSKVTGGATGGGGSNYTGGYSGTVAVGPCP